MSSPPPKSLAPVPSSVPTVWPPSNPSGTVIPFPLPWGQTGCCPPGGMDALMKCYCDIQQASAFIGQIMLDQINNNPAIAEAIIAAIAKSGSSVPLVGVTNGTPAQPGQVGEFIPLVYEANLASGTTQLVISLGVLPPGDWMLVPWALPGSPVSLINWVLNPAVPGVSNGLEGFLNDPSPGTTQQLIVGQSAQALTSVPSLLAFNMSVVATAAGLLQFEVECWRMR